MIAEYSTKTRDGLTLIRYGRRWCPIVYGWRGPDDSVAMVETDSGGIVECPHKGQWLHLPSGRRTRYWYH